MEELLTILYKLKGNIDFENETALIDKELMDSMDLMELISELEDAFNISIDMEDIIPSNFNSAEAMWAMIEKLQNN